MRWGSYRPSTRVKLATVILADLPRHCRLSMLAPRRTMGAKGTHSTASADHTTRGGAEVSSRN